MFYISSNRKMLTISFIKDMLNKMEQIFKTKLSKKNNLGDWNINKWCRVFPKWVTGKIISPRVSQITVRWNELLKNQTAKWIRKQDLLTPVGVKILCVSWWNCKKTIRKKIGNLFIYILNKWLIWYLNS